MGRWFKKRGGHIVDTYQGDPRGFELATGGGGSGLNVGAWQDLDTGSAPFGDDALVLDSLDVPCEIEILFTPEPNSSGGFLIADADTAEGYVQVTGNWLDAVTTQFGRTILPAGAHPQVQPIFGGNAYVIGSLRRRTLG